MKNSKMISVSVIIVLLITLLWNYLSYKNVEFKLVGPSEINMSIGDTWKELGYSLKKGDKLFDTKVEITGEVLNKVGSYNIVYKTKIGLFTKKIERKINVLEDNQDYKMELVGDKVYYLMNGKEYVDPGVIAYDVLDGDISKNVITTNNINNNVDGDYEVSYTITNSSNITKKLIRKVVVYSFLFETKLKDTDFVQETDILINIMDNIYQYTLLPNGQKSEQRNIVYHIDKSDIYSFKFYDLSNNVLDYNLEVKNIDSKKPEGTCVLYLSDSGGKIEVDAKDDNMIKGYIYHHGNNSTNILNESNYSINTMDEEASVTIYDMANNTIDINCNTIDKSTTIPRSYTSEKFTLSNGRDYEYWFYKPNNNTVRQKLPLLIYLHGDGGKKSMNDVNLFSYPAFVSSGLDFPFYMIAPHVDKTDDFGTDSRVSKTYELINYIINNYNIDKDRIIIVGGSSGARGVYRMVTKYKDLFSCMVIGSGITYQLYEEGLTHLPIWFFHGEKDTIISYKDMQRHVDKINELGGNAKITIITGGSHDITEEVFKYPELIEWMISQKRK